MRIRAATIALTSVLLFVAALVPAAAEAAPKPLYISMGDSWAAGFGASSPDQAYTAQLFDALRRRYDCPPADSSGCNPLQHVDLAKSGATTPSLTREQLPDAVGLLKSRNRDQNRRNDVEVVSLSIGGNDVFGPIVANCYSDQGEQCRETIKREFAEYRDDLDIVLSRLRRAGGRSTKIVLGTYDNPVPTCTIGQQNPKLGKFADQVLEGGPKVPEGLHDVMRDVAADHRVRIAEVFGDLKPDDWIGGPDCLHPDDSGYDKVTKAFAEALGIG